MRAFTLFAIAAVSVNAQDDTVAEALRTVQQGIWDARTEGVNLKDAIVEGFQGTMDKVTADWSLSLEKIQKGKNDAEALIYTGDDGLFDTNMPGQ